MKNSRKSKKIEVGAHNNLPHYCIVGQPADFYVWINEDGAGSNTTWIKGEAYLYHLLRRLLLKNRAGFSDKIKDEFYNSLAAISTNARLK